MQNAYDYVQDYFSQAITALARTSPVELLKIARVIVQAANAHKTVYVFLATVVQQPPRLTSRTIY